ncbi:alpha-ribazole phosphatase [Cupriavidus basilensis]|uniref:Alpha-ribazole phosphatase n=1 Tax=Cupriavidus basilensis TaxID=68895 RepID=A0ABT6ARN8_9BURK|nr:alpha-ribazole phosphatase [Cupriavidus basilensis]MDF3835281.1 alpha-ribazole phosphatase [Cupriavidus basilensis]
MDLVLIRHARPLVAEGICYGALDLPLAQPVSPAPAQMRSALQGLAPGRIVSSTMARARATAALLADGLPGLEPEADARLRELDFGNWEGRAWDAVPRAELDAWAADLLHARPHGGESAAEAMARVAQWADALPAAAPDCLWVVTHAGPIRMLAAHWLGVPLATTLGWDIAWGASCRFTLGGATARLRWWNRL